MAARLAPADYDRLHHFIADDFWDAAPLESELLRPIARLIIELALLGRMLRDARSSFAIVSLNRGGTSVGVIEEATV